VRRYGREAKCTDIDPRDFGEADVGAVDSKCTNFDPRDLGEGEADPEAGQHATSQPLQDVRKAGVRAQSVAQNTWKESDGTEDDPAEKRED
jgi:hypothetical protein